MKSEQGNIVDQLGKFDLVLCTTNSHVKRNSHLTMGKGSAKELDEITGKEFSLFTGLYLQKAFPNTWQLPRFLTYGCCTPIATDHNKTLYYECKGSRLGVFQTKHHFYDNSLIDLVQKSTFMLIRLANVYPSIACPFPGIGFGGLTVQQVMPIIQFVPDNVTFFRL